MNWLKKTVAFDPPVPWYSPLQIADAMAKSRQLPLVRDLTVDWSTYGQTLRITTIDGAVYTIMLAQPIPRALSWRIVQIEIERPIA